MPTRILFLAYYFPPIGGGGVQRSAKFAKYLPEFGYKPRVVTVDPASFPQEREFRMDSRLQHELDRLDLRVVRLRDGRNFRLWRSRLFPAAWFAFYPWLYEPQIAFAHGAASEGIRRVGRERLRLVYTTHAPFSTIWSGYRIKRATGAKWVADLRDLWTPDSLGIYPSALHYRFLRGRERRYLSLADRIVTNTPLSRRRMVELLGPESERRVVLIPNGYDPDDFRGIQPVATPGRFVIAHGGTLYDVVPEGAKAAGRWYQPFPVDNDTRSLRYVLAGLKEALARRPDLWGKVLLRLIGYIGKRSRAAAEKAGLAEHIEATGYVDHERATALLLGSDALLLLQVSYEDAAKPTPNVPGKVYEYLAAHKPVLAPVGPGDARDLLAGLPGSFLTPPDDPAAIAGAIVDLADRHFRGEAVPLPDPASIERYSRRHLAGELAALFDEVLAER